MCVGLTAVLLQSCVNSVSIVSSLSSVSSVHSKQCSVAVQTWNLSKSFRPKLLPTKSTTVSTYFTTAEVHQNQQFGSFLVRFELKVQHFHTFTSLSHKVFIFPRKLCKSKCCFLRIFTTVRNFTRPLVATVVTNFNSVAVRQKRGNLVIKLLWKIERPTCYFRRLCRLDQP